MGTVVCEACGDEVSTTYDCRDCGEEYCVDCRLPTEHDCSAQEVEETAQTPREDPLESMDLSLPAGPRIDVFLPVWRLLPWQAYVGLAIVLFPITPLVLALHVYHERMDATAEEWVPSRLYYLPILLFVVSKLIITMGIVFTIAFSFVFGLVGTIIYAVQKRSQ